MVTLTGQVERTSMIDIAVRLARGVDGVVDVVNRLTAAYDDNLEQNLEADSFDIHTRGHTISVDQPAPGRVEVGPSPTELFVASIAGCAAYYAEQFLGRHGLPYEGLRVECGWAMRPTAPARVTRVNLRVIPPGAVPEYRRAELIAAVEECTVHNSLRQPRAISVELSDPDGSRDERVLVGSDTAAGR